MGPRRVNRQELAGAAGELQRLHHVSILALPIVVQHEAHRLASLNEELTRIVIIFGKRSPLSGRMPQDGRAMETQVIGPDGLPAVFENGAWVSSNRSYWWNGAAWVPIRKTGRELSFVKLGLGIVFVAILGYALYTAFTTQSAFTIGYYVGVIAFFAVLFVIFRFVGRWGWFGIVVRILCAALGLLKILTLIAHPPPA